MNRVKAAVSAARFQGNMVAKHYYYTSLRGRNGLVLYVTIHAAPENGNAHSQVAPDAQKSLRLTGGSCNHRRLCPKSTDAFRPIRCQFRRKIEIGEMGRQHRLLRKWPFGDSERDSDANWLSERRAPTGKIRVPTNNALPSVV